MTKSLVIGITGQTGAGKTTVSNFFHRLGLYIIDADKVSREVLLKYNEIIEKLVYVFGNDILDKNGNIIRKVLAERAFETKDKTKQLDKVMLPYIKNEIKEKIQINSNRDLIVIDAPLLFESGINKYCDFVISVVADENVRLERIIKRDNITANLARKRIMIQNDQSFYLERSNFVLDGNEEKEQLLSKAEEIIDCIRRGFNCV